MEENSDILMIVKTYLNSIDSNHDICIKVNVWEGTLKNWLVFLCQLVEQLVKT